MIYCSAIMCVVWCHCADFGADEYAILKGKVVEFQMTSQAVTLGRNTTSSQVDFDLSLEAPAFKISRKQATIHVSSDGEFVIRNEGRRPLYLDGKALVSGKSTKLQHNQVLEVMGSAAKPSPLLSASHLEWTIGIFLLPPPPLPHLRLPPCHFWFY